MRVVLADGLVEPVIRHLKKRNNSLGFSLESHGEWYRRGRDGSEGNRAFTDVLVKKPGRRGEERPQRKGCGGE